MGAWIWDQACSSEKRFCSKLPINQWIGAKCCHCAKQNICFKSLCSNKCANCEKDENAKSTQGPIVVPAGGNRTLVSRVSLVYCPNHRAKNIEAVPHKSVMKKSAIAKLEQGSTQSQWLAQSQLVRLLMQSHC